jgi:hypothetical protein
MRTCRIARAAILLKCNREVVAKLGELASLIQASFTSAVGFKVALGSLRFTLEANRRNSS